MTLHTYRYRRDLPFTASQLQRRVHSTAIVTAAAGGPVYDIQVDDTRLLDLDAVLGDEGYTRIVDDPVGTPVSQMRVSDGTILTVGSVADTQILKRSGTTIIGGSASAYDVRDNVLFDHFISGNADLDELALSGWRIDATGTGNAQNITGESGHPGILRQSCGTGATGRSAVELGTGALANIIIGGNVITFETLISLRVTVAAASLLRHQTGIGEGWALANPNPLTDGIYFRLEPLLSANLFGVVRASSVETTRNLGVAPTLGNWYRLGYTWTSGVGVQFLINGVATGAVVTTNVPTVLVAPGIRGDSAGGGSNPEIWTDYIQMTQVTSKET